MKLEQELHELLTCDPAVAAIKATGKSLCHPETKLLADKLAQKEREDRAAVLMFWKDVYRSCGWEYYHSVISRLGFELVFTKEDAYTDNLVFFEKETGCLLNVWHFGEIINEATVFYNWKPTGTMAGIPPNFSTGSFLRGTDRVWGGNRNAMEGLKTHLEFLKLRGKFVTPWVGDPMLVLGIQPIRGQSAAATEKVLAALPVEVQRATGVRHN